MTTEQQQSLATGAPLTQETFDDFVKRLRHDCEGEGARDHCTSNAIFKVEARQLFSGIDPDYADEKLVYCDEQSWFSPKEYWDDCDSYHKGVLNRAMQEWSKCQFMKASEDDQWYVLGQLPDHTVTGYQWRWEYVNAHFTKDAAEAFIKRKKHDYRDGMRVYVASQYYAWEYNAIKEAILDGTLVYVAPGAKDTHD